MEKSIIDGLKDQIKGYSENERNLLNELSAIKSELKVKSNQLEKMKNKEIKSSSSRGFFSKTNNDSSNISMENERLTNNLASKDGEIMDLESRIARLTGELNSMKSIAGSATSSLQAELDESHEIRFKLEKDLKNMKNKLLDMDSFARDKTFIDVDMNDISDKLKRANEELKTKDARISTLEQKISLISNGGGANHLQEELDIQLQRVQTLTEKNKALNSEVKELKRNQSTPVAAGSSGGTLRMLGGLDPMAAPVSHVGLPTGRTLNRNMNTARADKSKSNAKYNALMEEFSDLSKQLEKAQSQLKEEKKKTLSLSEKVEKIEKLEADLRINKDLLTNEKKEKMNISSNLKKSKAELLAVKAEAKRMGATTLTVEDKSQPSVKEPTKSGLIVDLGNPITLMLFISFIILIISISIYIGPIIMGPSIEFE